MIGVILRTGVDPFFLIIFSFFFDGETIGLYVVLDGETIGLYVANDKGYFLGLPSFFPVGLKRTIGDDVKAETAFLTLSLAKLLPDRVA